MAKEPALPIQFRLIENLRRVSPHKSLVDEISEVLNISMDSAYRRIRCTTAITVDEMVLLCRHFRLSPEILMEKVQGMVTFSYKSLGLNQEDLNNYLLSIIQDLENAISFTGTHLYFTAEDVPIFHHLDYPYLTPFKFFYWKKSILNEESLHGKKYDASFISSDTLQLASRISKLYQAIPSTEIWTEETINSMLSQLLYYAESDLFHSKNDALLILQDIREMCQHLQKQAEYSSKFGRGDENPIKTENFNLYSCEVQIGNNSILLNSDKLKISLLSFNTFNSLLTFNLAYCKENEQWIQNLIKKSVLISNVSEKQRLQFFKNVSRQIDKAEERINQI